MRLEVRRQLRLRHFRVVLALGSRRCLATHRIDQHEVHGVSRDTANIDLLAHFSEQLTVGYP